MKSTRLVGPVAAVCLVGMGGIATPANAVTSAGCVTLKEFQQVHKGMTKYRVHTIFGTRGILDYTRHRNGHLIEVRDYRPCGHKDYGGVWIRFRDGRLYDGSAVF